MSEYISKETAKEIVFDKIINNVVEDQGMYGYLVYLVNEAFDEVPAADVRPAMLAYWKSVPYKRARVCSRCEVDEPYKFADDDANVYNFCPNCGAKMEGK